MESRPNVGTSRNLSQDGEIVYPKYSKTGKGASPFIQLIDGSFNALQDSEKMHEDLFPDPKLNFMHEIH